MIADEAIILAGGRGTRLRSVVSDVPKPLAPVAGRPFLAWMLDRLAASGIRRCILAVGHGAEVVQAAIGRRWSGMQIDYSVEHQPLGTGGAVALAINLLSRECVHVLNGDTYLEYAPAALERATRRTSAHIGMALARVADVSRYGTVEAADELVNGFSEKGRVGAGWINAGCYFLARRALERLPRGSAFALETDFLEREVRGGTKVAAFTETSGFIDIGVPEDYARAQRLFAATAA